MIETILTVLAVGLGGGLLALATFHAALHVYDRIRDRWRANKWDGLSYVAERQQVELNSVRVIEPDQHGRQGVTFDGRVYRSLDTGRTFTQELNLFFDPVMERLDMQFKLLQALAGASGSGAAKAGDVAELAAPAVVWPDLVRLGDLFTDKRPSIHDLVIGVYPTASGLDTVRLSLHDLMHTLTVGASGWGKSTWLRSLLWQVARAAEPIEVVAIDISGSEFNTLRDWGRLRYPVARSTADAAALLGAVSEEITRRRDLFESNAPVASKLTEYNSATGADLPPWLVCIDEGTSLLNKPGIGDPIRDAVQRARQYGVYCLVAGQSAQHRVIPTQIRDQFSSRLCFRTSPTSSRVVLDDSAAGGLTKKGRFWAGLVGRELAELQGPFIGRDEFMQALTNGGPRHAMPEGAGIGDQADGGGDNGATAEEIELIRQLWAESLSLSEITRRVYGTKGGAGFYKVRDVIDG